MSDSGFRDKISVVIPAYNAEKTIEKTVDSVLRQNYGNIEVVITDDGSSDGTYDVICRLAESDSRIVVMRQENKGPSEARNRGIYASSGERIMFLDSDDEMGEGLFERIVSMTDDDCDLFVWGIEVKPHGGEAFNLSPSAGNWPKANYYEGIEMLLDAKCFSSMCNKMFKASVIKENGLRLRAGLNMGEDHLFVIDYLKKMNGMLRSIPDALYVYNLSETGLQGSFDNRNYLGRVERTEYLKSLYTQNGYPMGGVYSEYARCFYTLTSVSEDPAAMIKSIYALPQYRELCENKKLVKGRKYRLFANLLCSGNTSLTLAFVKAFLKYKSSKGRQMFKKNDQPGA